MLALRIVDVNAAAAPACIPDQPVGIDHRAEDFVGIAMPTVPLPWAKAPVTAVAAMVAASATADNMVFRLVMLHSL